MHRADRPIRPLRELVTALTLSLATPAMAGAEWVVVGGDKGQTEFMNANRLTQHGQFVRGSVKTTFDAPQRIGDRVFRSMLTSGLFDCHTREARLTSTQYYAGPDANGALIHSENSPSGPILLVAPETPGEAWLDYACENVIPKGIGHHAAVARAARLA